VRPALHRRGRALTARLPTVRRGYRRADVDALLLRAAATLGPCAARFPELAGLHAGAAPADPVTRREVERARFPVVVRGYELAAVDDLLRRLRAALPEDATWCEPPQEPPADPWPAIRLTLRGYDTEEVDAFLARAAHTLGRRVRGVPELGRYVAVPRADDPLEPREIERVQFRVRRRGYDIVEVDALLDRVVRLLRAEGSG
jgi:DivIVA domain-containing protein